MTQWRIIVAVLAGSFMRLGFSARSQAQIIPGPLDDADAAQLHRRGYEEMSPANLAAFAPGHGLATRLRFCL